MMFVSIRVYLVRGQVLKYSTKTTRINIDNSIRVIKLICVHPDQPEVPLIHLFRRGSSLVNKRPVLRWCGRPQNINDYPSL